MDEKLVVLFVVARDPKKALLEFEFFRKLCFDEGGIDKRKVYIEGGFVLNTVDDFSEGVATFREGNRDLCAQRRPKAEKAKQEYARTTQTCFSFLRE